jgi:hypothetical protein
MCDARAGKAGSLAAGGLPSPHPRAGGRPGRAAGPRRAGGRAGARGARAGGAGPPRAGPRAPRRAGCVLSVVRIRHEATGRDVRRVDSTFSISCLVVLKRAKSWILKQGT